MNLAQALESLGHGCYRYRDDLSPGPAVLAREAMRHLDATPQVRRWRNLSRRHDALLIHRVLQALRAAWRSRVKMECGELCESLGASKASKRVQKALRILCQRRLAQREGNNRRAVYWAGPPEGGEVAGSVAAGVESNSTRMNFPRIPN
jgi:hypothetical protein